MSFLSTGPANTDRFPWALPPVFDPGFSLVCEMAATQGVGSFELGFCIIFQWLYSSRTSEIISSGSRVNWVVFEILAFTLAFAEICKMKADSPGGQKLIMSAQ